MLHTSTLGRWQYHFTLMALLVVVIVFGEVWLELLGVDRLACRWCGRCLMHQVLFIDDVLGCVTIQKGVLAVNIGMMGMWRKWRQHYNLVLWDLAWAFQIIIIVVDLCLLVLLGAAKCPIRRLALLLFSFLAPATSIYLLLIRREHIWSSISRWTEHCNREIFLLL